MCEKCDVYARMLGFQGQEHLGDTVADKLSDCVEDILENVEPAIKQQVRNSRITEYEGYDARKMVNETIASAIIGLLSHHVDESSLDPAAALRSLAVLMERDQKAKFEKKVGVTFTAKPPYGPVLN